MSLETPPSTNEPAAAGLFPVDPPPGRILDNTPATGTVENAPVPIAKPGETLSMDAFKDVLPEIVPTLAKPSHEVKVAPVTNDNKLEIAPVTKDTIIPLSAPVIATVTPPISNARDYSVFEETERDLLKKASNEVFAHLSKELPRLRAIEKQAKEAQQNGMRLPDSLAQHPNAYTLSPEFVQVSQELKYLTFEENHWTEQARRAEAGEREVFDLAYDAQGNPKFTAIALTAENISGIKVGLSKNINQTVASKQQYTNAATQIQQTYGTRWNKASETLREAEEKYFGAYKAADNPRAKEIAQFKQLLPSEFQQHPLANTVAKLYAYILDGSAAYKKLEMEVNATKQIQQDRTAAGPTASAATGSSGGTRANGNQLSMADFTARLG